MYDKLLAILAMLPLIAFLLYWCKDEGFWLVVLGVLGFAGMIIIPLSFIWGLATLLGGS